MTTEIITLTCFIEGFTSRTNPRTNASKAYIISPEMNRFGAAQYGCAQKANRQRSGAAMAIGTATLVGIPQKLLLFAFSLWGSLLASTPLELCQCCPWSNLPPLGLRPGNPTSFPLCLPWLSPGRNRVEAGRPRQGAAGRGVIAEARRLFLTPSLAFTLGPDSPSIILPTLISGHRDTARNFVEIARH